MTRLVGKLPNINLLGIGANLACRNGISPDNRNMEELSALAAGAGFVDTCNPLMISGGNSGNLDWVFGNSNIGSINNLRLGEAILFGCETLQRNPIDGLYTDAITLITEVIESKIKPSMPWGSAGQSAFGEVASPKDQGEINQAIVAIGRQDIDPEGLIPPPGVQVLGASSDHLVLNSGTEKLKVGAEITFGLNYSAFLRAMTCPYVAKTFHAAAMVPASSH